MDNNNHEPAKMSITLPELIKKDDVDGVKNFLDKNGLPKYSNWDDYNLLIYLLENRKKEIATLFIEKGCRLNRFLFDWKNRSPLHLAIEMEDLDIVQMLLAKGASTTAKNMNEETPLILAAIIQNNEITDRILPMVTPDNHSNYEGFSHMHIACMRNRIDIVKKFLQNGVNINHAVNLKSLHWPGYTPLHFAIHFKCIETVQFLVSNGADITAKAKNRLTPLHLAFRVQNELIIDTMLSVHCYHAGNPVNSEGLSHFHIACTRNNLEVVKDFVERRVKVGHEIPYGTFNWESYTAVSFAIEYGQTNVAKFLIAHNDKLCIINLDNIHRHIFHACFKANEVIIDSLLSLRISKYISDQRSKYPSSYCFFYKQNKFTTINEVIPYEKSVDNIMDCESVQLPRYTKLHFAIEHKQKKALAKWIKKTKPNYSDYDDNTETDPDVDSDTGIDNYNDTCIDTDIDNYADTDDDIDDDTNLIRVKDARGKTALHLAFESNKLKIVDTMLSLLDGVVENPADNTGLSHFHISCTRDNPSDIEKFLKIGVNINSSVNSDATFWSGFTPLHFAVNFRQPQVVEFLLNHDADISIKNALGSTPLDLAVQCIANDCREENHDNAHENCRSHLTIIELLLLSGKSGRFASFDDRGLSLLHVASAKNDEAAIEHLVTSENINKACDASLPIWRGYTPLHVAVHFGSSNAIRLLLDLGADVSLEDAEGNAPVHPSLAKRNKFDGWSYKIDCDPRLLLTARNITGRSGRSSFHIACELNDTQAVRHFLELGVDVDEPILLDSSDEHTIGKTGLHLALEARAHEAARLLVRSGASVHAKDGYLNTPLHRCADVELVEELLARGADVNALNVYGDTPAGSVFQGAQPTLPLVRAFLENGADMSAENGYGRSPLAYATSQGQRDLSGVLEAMRHVRSRSLLGVAVSKANQRCYDRLLRECRQFCKYREADFVHQCRGELERARSKRINGRDGLYDVLFMDSSRMARQCENPGLREIVEAGKFDAEFPIYGYLVKLQLKRGAERKSLVEQGEASLGLLTGRGLGSVCSEMIFEFLTDYDLRSLIEAAK